MKKGIPEPKRAVIFGIDGGHPELVQKFIKEGKLPNFEKVMKEGVFKEALEPFPTITPPNWTTITTGAWPGTHGITDFFLPHNPGEPLDKVQFAFDTRKSQAEYIWQAAERAGKKSILIKWEVSWPPNHSGIQVEGCGPGLVNLHEIGPVRLHTLEPLPMTNQIELKPAENWKGLSASAEALEGKISLFLHGGGEKFYDLAVIKTSRSGYDKILITSEKDAAHPIASCTPGQWSEWVLDEFDLTPDPERIKAREAERGRIRKYSQKEIHDAQASTTSQAREAGLGMNEALMTVKGTLRFKLLNLAGDGSEMELLSTQIWPVSGYTQPRELGPELLEKAGPFFTNPARDALHYGWIDEGTFYELMDYQHQWLGKAAKHLSATREWDLLFVETHCCDYLSHFYLKSYQPECGSTPSEQRNALSWLTRHYQSIDRLLGELLSIVDEETLLIIVSDHSGTGSAQPLLDVRKVFEQAGLLALNPDSATGMKRVDWSKTKAFPQRSIHVYLNLKGRDPQGIVDPGDYDKVVDEVIQAMMDYKDPATGKHPFSLVLRKEDAALLGLWGDRIGDIIYALRPEYDMEHGSELPTARVGELTIRSLFFMKGPNVKKGLHLQRLVQLTAVAPTIAFLLGFPIPAQAEGAVLWEALEVPDFRTHQVMALRKELERWKKLYAGLAVEYDLNPRPVIED